MTSRYRRLNRTGPRLKAMSQRRDEAPQLQEEGPQTGGSGLPDRSGTRREETLSDLLCATVLHLNTVENEDYSEEDNTGDAPPSRRQCLEQEDEEYEVIELWSSSSSWRNSILDSIPSMDAHSSSEHFCGKRKRRMATTDEEDSDEEGLLRKRQRVEQEGDRYELGNLGSSSSSSWSSSSILDSIPSVDAHSSSEHFCGKRKRRMATTDEEDSDEEGLLRKRQRVEQEGDGYELGNLGSSSSSSWSSSSILDSIPSVDAHSSSEHFCGKRKRRMETSDEEDIDEEAPPRKRLCNPGSRLSSSLTLSPTLEFIPTIDSSSSDFWWRMMRRRELMSGEEVTNDEEAPPARWESVEPEDDEFEVFEQIDLERSLSPSSSLSSSLDLMSFIDASTGHQFSMWVSRYEDLDDMSAYDDMPEHHQSAEVRVPQVLLVFLIIYIISVDPAPFTSLPFPFFF
ncbi:hypothetical protein QTP70_000131 [Hemibagrus guttatus]|uniref:Uncharacterized protein n=1 Tax=Hemibagrus guttatus TaxID=175788 RepID=A0AAE0QPH4_9TELE|nr:hypothetical protein QTP70_000131 [Hemibagrus guttatus]